MGREPEPDDFKGLQCRWEPLYSQRGTNLSLMVQRVPWGMQINRFSTVKFLLKLLKFAGSLRNGPASPSNMHLTLNPRRMMSEYKHVRQLMRGGKRLLSSLSCISERVLR